MFRLAMNRTIAALASGFVTLGLVGPGWAQFSEDFSTVDETGGGIFLDGQGTVSASGNWDNGAIVDAGASTWGNGTTGITGAVTTANSLYGTTASDKVGELPAVALSNGNYVVSSRFWNNGAINDAGTNDQRKLSCR